MKYEIQDIMRMATSLAVFKRGNDYYKKNRVVRCTYAPDLERIYAKVEGTEPYHIDIRLDEGHIDDAYCDCRAFHDYPGFCKHIVAVLLYTKFNYNIEPESVELDSVLDYYMDQEFDDIEGYQDLEVDYVLVVDEELESSLNIKMGMDNMYLLKEPLKFFNNLNEAYSFGKKFEYDPFVHKFSDYDMALFEFLKSILISYENFNERKMQYKNIDSKDINLSKYHLIELLKRLEKPFVLKYKDNQIPVMAVMDDIRPELVIEEAEGRLKLHLSDLKAFEPLTEDYAVIKFENHVHVISDQQRKELLPLFQMVYHQYEQMDIKNEELDNFMSYMYPVIDRSSKVVISENLESKLLRHPCESQLFLDQRDGVIYADLKYIYGDHVIDAFVDYKHDQDIFICRDLKQENRIMHIIESSAFKVSKDGYYMSNEEDVYMFLTDKLPALQKHLQVFYSDAFYKLEVKEHESFTMTSDLDESGDFFSFKFSMEGVDLGEIDSLIDHIKEKKKYYRLKDGSFLSLDDPYFDALNDMLYDLDIEAADFENGVKRLPTYLAFYFNETLGKTAIMDDKLKAIVAAPSQEEHQLPPVDATLRPYQYTGFNWLKTLSKYGFGGILADDMGLGKTIQTLSYIQSEIMGGYAEKVLIVAPTSLVYNWMNEIHKFFPDMKALIVDGNKKQRENKLASIDDFDLLITSYALVRNDLDLYKRIALDICVIDEAQHIKNPTSKTAKAVKSLDIKRKFALTGTPIENKLLELWSIFDFIMPQYLGGVTKFKSKYELPIKNNEPTPLKKMVEPFILRRLKGDVLTELPEKIENKMVVELTDDQKKVYMATLNKYKEELSEIYKRDGYKNSQMKTLAALTRLRQICLHPGLFMDAYKGDSAKLNLLEELLEELLAGQHRMLIFSQFTSMLARIKDLLDAQGIDYYYIDGKTKAIDRNKKVDEFNAGKTPVFLISLKAGGTGLNLTGADTVIHMDPWWNPAVEDQATDRAHRIGQKRSVHVIKIVTQGTIEEKIYELQDRKKALIQQVIQPGETFITGLSEEDVKALFS